MWDFPALLSSHDVNVIKEQLTGYKNFEDS